MQIDIDELIRKEREYHESIEPVDVEVVLGGKILTVRVPYVYGPRFDAIADKYPVERWQRGNRGHFDLGAVTREHPDVLLIDGDKQDDMFVLRDRVAVYRWPEVYDALSGEAQETLQAVIWGLHVKMPRDRLAEAMENSGSFADAVEIVSAVDNG